MQRTGDADDDDDDDDDLTMTMTMTIKNAIEYGDGIDDAMQRSER